MLKNIVTTLATLYFQKKSKKNKKVKKHKSIKEYRECVEVYRLKISI